MEVTASNFKTVLPEVEKAIENCTFLSIDCELTGLNIEHNIKAFDTPSQYEKATNVFKQQSYNFFIFRRPVNRNIPDQRFLCQTSSIHFLISQGFDFNKLFQEGISYLNLSEENTYKTNIEETYKKRMEFTSSQSNGTNSDMIPVPDNVQPFIDDIEKQIKAFFEW
ncbi:hypothetical protein NQ317_005641 [Molorchus minor]|uniref:Uncharacterized protein n=1 Tax=Molorchus minor TaxID=1323400 RepID=A0ABQ9K9D8_9CUCU|nr:hypothetical protein NQ317_005641 [Molorchus minor]